MKKIGLLLFCIFILSSFVIFAQEPIDPNTMNEGRNGLYADFEDDTIDDLGEITWTAFDCADASTIEVVDNPDTTGGNTSDYVAKFVTTSCTWEGTFTDQEYVPMNMERNYFSVDVYAPEAGRTVMLKLEKFDDNQVNIEVSATTTVANQWETLEFDFTGAESGTFGRITVFPDFNGTNEGEVWYFDNIWQYRDPISYKDGLLADFEDKNPWFHFWDCNDGFAEFFVVDNPEKDDVNSSDKVGWMFTSGCEWEGFANDEKFIPFEYDFELYFTIKVLAPDAGRTVLMKLENFEDKNIAISVEAYTVSSGGWEELVFDFTDVEGLEPGVFGRVAIFPDFWTYTEEDWFLDDLTVYEHTTAVEKQVNTASSFDLKVQNYPNPFNPQTTISYSLPKTSNVILAVYDIQGKEIVTLVNESKTAGSYNVSFDGSDFASGVYFYKLQAGKQIVTNKMLLVK